MRPKPTKHSYACRLLAILAVSILCAGVRAENLLIDADGVAAKQDNFTFAEETTTADTPTLPPTELRKSHMEPGSIVAGEHTSQNERTSLGAVGDGAIVDGGVGEELGGEMPPDGEVAASADREYGEDGEALIDFDSADESFGETDDGGLPEFTLDTTLKFTGFGSHSSVDPLLAPEEWSAAGFVRARFSLASSWDDWMNTELAYEHRTQLSTEGGGGGGGITGALATAEDSSWRIQPLDWSLARSGNAFEHRHDVDRALVAFHPEWGEVTIGRQAVGLGRGQLFSAVDVFSPFSPLEVDREFRRGVDAARAEWRVSDTSSVEALAVMGDSWDDSALVARVRGYIGDIDGSFIAGKHAEDEMYGAVVSAAVGDAEVHGEVALFTTPEEHPDGGLFGVDHLVGKAVIGSSYTFDVGDGLTVLGEYHYSGFGVEDMSDAVLRLSDRDFANRFLRGDTQILSQHVLGARATLPVGDSWTYALTILQSPADGSGTAIPSLVWDVAENTTLLLYGFVGWGEGPADGTLHSQYGASPTSLFLQLTLYY